MQTSSKIIKTIRNQCENHIANETKYPNTSYVLPLYYITNTSLSKGVFTVICKMAFVNPYLPILLNLESLDYITYFLLQKTELKYLIVSSPL